MFAKVARDKINSQKKKINELPIHKWQTDWERIQRKDIFHNYPQPKLKYLEVIPTNKGKADVIKTLRHWRRH